ncbi:hypothetical protein SCAB_61151 [Streptomyces scabiei 87.22]|uniref:Uncharacterized protein n=1 Tax=Streptomyces scabiei (strain 87.22) TaxID=680198 RepID=C9Z947_STRSW|nr:MULTISPECIES: DUF6093 family protein [Streptomyces]MBP5875660.1 hypothetical protein [Streptomyces sp. LBUM 1477]MDX2652114.1 DUF6093 family protein [Streptomyces scabiei]MDX2725860.1 DUF6093 family protein [Streptomyces scabiei]MDX2749650.1 DUF6093 family protein [Streptomyces scabiei]MDX2863979.1 DUF6093 family protein [Streptomyces scabiei]
MSALDAALAAGRREAEALMRDTVSVYRPGPDLFDRDSGQTVPGQPAVTFYTGRARVKVEQLADSEVQAGEQEVTLRQYKVTIPFATELPETGERPRPGDVIDVTASPDPRLTGLRLWVSGVQYSGTATAWRIIAEDRSP